MAELKARFTMELSKDKKHTAVLEFIEDDDGTFYFTHKGQLKKESVVDVLKLLSASITNDNVRNKD